VSIDRSNISQFEELTSDMAPAQRRRRELDYITSSRATFDIGV
jgi:hypothetical protein